MKPNSSSVRHKRVDVADVLRGFAVLAIILIHSIEHFNFYSFPTHLYLRFQSHVL
ncbi:MAG: hypothetical protein K2M85_10250 [Paramuribaculum sp.]|nr:hypothetical protein [Paramuribaculum sp.]